MTSWAGLAQEVQEWQADKSLTAANLAKHNAAVAASPMALQEQTKQHTPLLQRIARGNGGGGSGNGESAMRATARALR